MSSNGQWFLYLYLEKSNVTATFISGLIPPHTAFKMPCENTLALQCTFQFPRVEVVCQLSRGSILTLGNRVFHVYVIRHPTRDFSIGQTPFQTYNFTC